MNAPHVLAFLSGPPGSLEWLVLFVVILLLFGPKRLPEIARTIGKVAEQLRRASQDFRDQILRIDEPVTSDSEAGVVDVEDAEEVEEPEGDEEKSGHDPAG